ncbi:disulfide isomerase [Coprinopsis cinerea AmutBmut pab1-1]|nr:disulfide isomerase [Coprinopsis cinerea AmutBmut pab1-1]
MRLSVSLFVSALVAAVAASNVVELTPENFDSVIGKGKPALVEFFAPWCGHCKNLAPTYEELADVFAHAKDRVVIAKVDADGAGRSLGAKYGVKGFPTLKWFDEVGKDVEEYKGGRELETLAEYVTKQSGVKSKIPEPPPPAYTVLHENNWDEIVNDPTKHVLVSFTVDAPWCRDCKDAKINWDRAAQWFQSDNVVLANVNLDEPRNGRFTSMYNIMVYPTIKFFPKGNKSGENIEYEKLKTDKDVVTFLNNRAGTNRLVGGKLNLVVSGWRGV